MSMPPGPKAMCPLDSWGESPWAATQASLRQTVPQHSQLCQPRPRGNSPKRHPETWKNAIWMPLIVSHNRKAPAIKVTTIVKNRCPVQDPPWLKYWLVDSLWWWCWKSMWSHAWYELVCLICHKCRSSFRLAHPSGPPISLPTARLSDTSRLASNSAMTWIASDRLFLGAKNVSSWSCTRFAKRKYLSLSGLTLWQTSALWHPTISKTISDTVSVSSQVP